MYQYFNWSRARDSKSPPHSLYPLNHHTVMVKRPMYESAHAKYPGVVVWALARGASNNSDACAPFFPSRRDTIDVLCTWPSYERRAASPTRLALGYYTYKHTCTFTIPLFPCTLVVRVLRIYTPELFPAPWWCEYYAHEIGHRTSDV